MQTIKCIVNGDRKKILDKLGKLSGIQSAEYKIVGTYDLVIVTNGNEELLDQINMIEGILIADADEG